MARRRVVEGSYLGAIPWEMWADTPAKELARELALSAPCTYYTVDGRQYGPFDEDEIEQVTP